MDEDTPAGDPALDLLRKIVNGDGWVNFGTQWERPFLSLDLRIDVTEAELDLIASLEST